MTCGRGGQFGSSSDTSSVVVVVSVADSVVDSTLEVSEIVSTDSGQSSAAHSFPASPAAASMSTGAEAGSSSVSTEMGWESVLCPREREMMEKIRRNGRVIFMVL